MERVNRETILGREQIIRYTGVLLTLSPIGNYLTTVMLSGIPDWYRWQVLFGLISQLRSQFWITSALNLVAGLLMIKGRRSSWNFTLCVIATTIIFDVINFKADFGDGWAQPVIGLLINVGFFALIYSQEVHQRLERKLLSMPQINLKKPNFFDRTLARKFKGGPKVEMEGIGSWAEISEITHEEIRLKPLSEKIPQGIEARTIEITLGKDLVVQARFVRRSEAGLCFRFINLSPIALAGLRRWKRA